MGQVRIILPDPPVGRFWCVVGLNDYRNKFNEAWDIAKIEAALGPDEEREFKGWPAGAEVPPLPCVAVTMGIYMLWYPFLSNQVYPVCHMHFTPMAFTQVTLAQGQNVKDAVAAFRRQSPGGLAIPG